MHLRVHDPGCKSCKSGSGQEEHVLDDSQDTGKEEGARQGSQFT